MWGIMRWWFYLSYCLPFVVISMTSGVGSWFPDMFQLIRMIIFLPPWYMCLRFKIPPGDGEFILTCENTPCFKPSVCPITYILSYGYFNPITVYSASPIFDIISLIIVLCWIDWYDALPITPMFWNIIIIPPFLPNPLSWWTQSPWWLLLGFVSVFFRIPLWHRPVGCG